MATSTAIDALEVAERIAALRVGCTLLTRAKGVAFEDKRRIIEAFSLLGRFEITKQSDAFCNGCDLVAYVGRLVVQLHETILERCDSPPPRDERRLTWPSALGQRRPV